MPDNTERSGTSNLIENLQRADCYPHPVTRIELLETHISWVLLAGDYAYKIKKPVNLGFLDFTTLIQRRSACEDELRLNRRFAPQLYLEVVAVTGSADAPLIGGAGPVIEYAVKMQRFPQEALASAALAAGLLQSRHLEGFARQLAALHDSAPRSDRHSPYGAPAAIRDAALQNFDQLQPLLITADDVTALTVLRDWTLRELTLRQAMMRERHAAGTVREGHGDLHLGNIVLIDDRLVPFDCIEFNVELRWNDLISEVAFLVMDLHDRSSPKRAWLFLNAWLEESGDYSGVALLPFYLVYRAMVRAKVHALRAAQFGVGHAEHARLMGESRKYIALARQFAHGKPPALIITHGLSGSGKSCIAGEVMQQLGAIRIRSDVERKRLHGLLPHERSASSIGGSIYNDQATQALYHHLASLAQTIIAAGYTVIVDASFLKRWQRDCLRDVARDTSVPFLMMSITAPDAVLRTRIRQREAAGNDPSDAGIAVLEHQLQSQEALSAGERPATIMLSSNSQSAATCSQQAIEFLAARKNN